MSRRYQGYRNCRFDPSHKSSAVKIASQIFNRDELMAEGQTDAIPSNSFHVGQRVIFLCGHFTLAVVAGKNKSVR